jgi:LytS/YehU family sensor histidine kinase
VTTETLKNRAIIYTLAGLILAGVIAYGIWLTAPSTAIYISIGWFVIVMALLLWGNRFLNSKFDKILPWKRWGNFRFFTLLFIGLVYLLIVINVTYILLKVAMTADPPTHGQIMVTNVLGACIFIPIFSISFSLHFLKHWRKSELEAEKIQKANIRTQLNSLKTQLDPHFLFNNLNILSALIDQDTKKSKTFIENFAEVYRSLLRSKSDDLITLKEELEFIDAYIFLIRTRFENHVQFTVNINPSSQGRMLPPLTLQLLIENAIKHNSIDEKNPLAIHLLQMNEDYIIVSNSLNEARVKDNRKGSGLDNIRERYAYFTDKAIRIVKTSSHFEVHIPLLDIEQH